LTKIKKNNNWSNFNRSSIVWFVIYIGVALIISFTVPFPLSIILYTGIYLIFQTCRFKSIRKRFYHTIDSNQTDKETKNKGSNKFFRPFYNILFGGNQFPQFGPQPLKFICMNCGKEHSNRKCPVCGSTAVKLG
jgi:hypothetical protein